MYSIKDLESLTGLKYQFLRECLKQFPGLFKQHTKHGNKNKILLDEAVFPIFDRIKQMKEQGLSMPEIRLRLEQAFPDQFPQPPPTPTAQDTPPQTLSNNLQTPHYIQQLFDLHEKISQLKDQHLKDLQEKEKEIYDLIRRNEALEGEIKMLPDGKSPDDIRKEYEARQREAIRQEIEAVHQQRDVTRLIADLEHHQGFLQGKRRKALLDELKALLLPSPERPEDSEQENSEQN